MDNLPSDITGLDINDLSFFNIDGPPYVSFLTSNQFNWSNPSSTLNIYKTTKSSLSFKNFPLATKWWNGNSSIIPPSLMKNSSGYWETKKFEFVTYPTSTSPSANIYGVAIFADSEVFNSIGFPDPLNSFLTTDAKNFFYSISAAAGGGTSQDPTHIELSYFDVSHLIKLNI